jgi:hypothetical protein
MKRGTPEHEAFLKAMAEQGQPLPETPEEAPRQERPSGYPTMQAFAVVLMGAAIAPVVAAGLLLEGRERLLALIVGGWAVIPIILLGCILWVLSHRPGKD